MPHSLVDTAVDFSNVMPKANFKTHVTSTKVYLRPPDFFLISRLAKRTQWKDTLLDACFYVSNSEVNSRSIDFNIFYILKQQFIESVCKSHKV